jgi:hypothetical protein
MKGGFDLKTMLGIGNKKTTSNTDPNNINMMEPISRDDLNKLMGSDVTDTNTNNTENTTSNNQYDAKQFFDDIGAELTNEEQKQQQALPETEEQVNAMKKKKKDNRKDQ